MASVECKWWFTLIFSITLLLYSSQVNTDTALPHSEWDFSKLHGTILSTICVLCVLPRPWKFFVLWFFFFCYKHHMSFWSFNDFNVFLVIQMKNYVSVSVLGECSKGYEQSGFFYFGPFSLYFVCCPGLETFLCFDSSFFATLTNAFLKL